MTVTYTLFNKGELVLVTNDSPWTGTPVTKKFFDKDGKEIVYDTVKDFHEYKSFEEVELIAAKATELTGTLYIATGSDSSRYYDITIPPAIGDMVSKSFNGDSYPVGKIIHITPTWRISVDDGKGNITKFRRVKRTANWVEINGCFSLVKGTISRLNPEF